MNTWTTYYTVIEYNKKYTWLLPVLGTVEFQNNQYSF